MKKMMYRAFSLILAAVLFFSMFPVTAAAASTTLGTPTSVKINKTLNHNTGALVTSYGSVSWKPAKPFPSGTAWYTLKIYRNGKLVGGHEMGFDPNYLSTTQYISYDLSPMIDWESGTYYVTVQAANRGMEGAYNSSKIAKSAEWKYTKPSKKLAMPTGAKWASSSGYSLPKATWKENASGATHRLYYFYSPTKTDDITGCGSQWYVYGNSVVPYMDYGPGYYYFTVRAISGDLSKYAHSNITEMSAAFHYKLAAPAPSVKLNSVNKPVISWKAVEYADSYDVYRSTSENGQYKKLASPSGTSYTDTSAEEGTTYYYRIRSSRDNGVKSSYAKAISIAVLKRNTVKITAQPQSVTVAKGATAKVTVKATGDGLTYRWYYKDKGASGYTYTSSFKGNTYSVSMTEARNGRRVLCKVYDKYGNMVQSSSALLSMKAEQKNTVKITAQPQSVTVEKGATAKVTVKATGDGLTYRWYYKDSGASGYTYTATFKSNTYSVAMTEARNGRRVLCKVYDKYGNMVQSSSALLRMK